MRRRLPFESPERQIELLQELLISGPGARWGGLSVREEARRRITALLDEHGRELYTDFEQRARDELARGLPLEAVEVRFPNAAAVSMARAAELERLLEDGRSRQAFEEAAFLTADDTMLALRERAARALGEVAYADLISGAASLPGGMPVLPRLPSNGDQAYLLELHDRFDVVFRQVTGRPTDAFSGCALGTVDTVGEMFLLDTRTGRMLWEGRSLPGRMRRVGAGVDFHMEDDLLVVKADTTLEVARLSDGHAVWSRTLSDLSSTLTVGGLVLALRQMGDQALRVDAYGLRTGSRAFSIDLPEAQYAPDLMKVGPHVVVSSHSYGLDGRTQDNRLVLLDLVRGEIARSTALEDEMSVVTSLPDPPTVFLSKRLSGTRSRLAAWSPESGELLWQTEVPLGAVKRKDLFATAPGRLLLRESTPLPNSRRRADLVHPVDARTGVQDAPAGIPLYSVVDGEGPLSPSVVMLDPDGKTRVCVLDGETGVPRYVLDFSKPLSGYTQAWHGRDGFVIVAQISYQPDSVTSVWIVRGADGEERYSVELNDSRHSVQSDVLLVDDAVLLAIGGSVHVIRGESQER
jgi:outer membrane protein assembly factor BamB